MSIYVERMHGNGLVRSDSTDDDEPHFLVPLPAMLLVHEHPKEASNQKTETKRINT